MPQINLLKQQKKTTGDSWQTLTTIMVKCLGFLLLLLILYYGYLLYQMHRGQAKLNNENAKLQEVQKSLSSIEGRDELYTRQQQLEQLMAVVANHAYWTKLLPALAQVTLKSAYYTRLQAQTDGSLTMDVSVPTIDDLDKFLQIFDLSQFNANFYNIRVSSIGKIQVGTQLLTDFHVVMQFNPAILKYQ